MPMTRQEAILNLIAAWSQADMEYCCTNQERVDSQIEMRASLDALGVTAEEMGW